MTFPACQQAVGEVGYLFTNVRKNIQATARPKANFYSSSVVGADTRGCDKHVVKKDAC